MATICGTGASLGPSSDSTGTARMVKPMPTVPCTRAATAGTSASRSNRFMLA